MNAWEWSVYPRLSSNPMVAAGITDEPDKARGEVEAVLGADDGAGWGVLQQVRVSAGEPGQAFQLHPAALNVQAGRPGRVRLAGRHPGHHVRLSAGRGKPSAAGPCPPPPAH